MIAVNTIHVTSHWPTVHTDWATPTGAHHWGMFGHFSRVHAARPQIRWKVLSWDHSDPQRPWSLPCARCTSALGCPGHGPILGEELLQVCAPHGGQLLHHLSFDATFWHSTSPNTNEVIRCCNPSYPVRSLETAVETSNTKG